MLGKALRAVCLACTVGGTGCSEAPRLHQTQAPNVRLADLKDFSALDKKQSLIGASFTFELSDDPECSQRVAITVSRPDAKRIELTMDESMYSVDDEKIERLIDVKKHKSGGIVLTGKTDVPFVNGDAVVEKAELQKALRNLRDTKKGEPPCLEVTADVDFIGRKVIRFSATQVR